MSYQVFARKYRPLTFDDVLGQDHVVRTLKNAIENNRLAHAYLFVGPRGTGKTSTSRIFAKALNCSNGPRVDFDPHEDICEEIAEGRSLDVLEIDGASNRGIDHIRELRDSVQYAPGKGKFRIVYIDEVHMLTKESFNALLKTLEEPPPHVKFIFATTEPHKILPTILSRCQRFDLRPIPAEIIAKHLLSIAEKEGVSLSAEAAFAVAKVADGGMRDAQSMLDQLVSFCGNKIEENQVLQIFGITSRETVAGALKHLIKKELPDLLHLLHEQAEAGRDMGQLLSEIISAVREILVAKVDPDATFDSLPESSREELAELVKRTQTDKILRLVEVLAETEDKMRWSTNKRLHLEMGLIKAVHALAEASISDIIMALDGAPLTTPAPLAAAPLPAAPAPPAPQPQPEATPAQQPAADAPLAKQTVPEEPSTPAVQQEPATPALAPAPAEPTDQDHDLMDPVPDFSAADKKPAKPADEPVYQEDPEPAPVAEPESVPSIAQEEPTVDYPEIPEEPSMVMEPEWEPPVEEAPPVPEPTPQSTVSAISDAPVSLPDASPEPDFLLEDPEKDLPLEKRTSSFFDSLFGMDEPAENTRKNNPAAAKSDKAAVFKELTQADWHNAVERASAKFPVMAGCLDGAHFAGQQGARVVIAFHPFDKNGINSLISGALKNELEADLSAVAGAKISLEVKADPSLPEPIQEELPPMPAPEPPAPRKETPKPQPQKTEKPAAPAPAPEEEPAQEDNSYYDDPLIQSALEKFRGRIISQ